VYHRTLSEFEKYKSAPECPFGPKKGNSLFWTSQMISAVPSRLFHHVRLGKVQKFTNRVKIDRDSWHSQTTILGAHSTPLGVPPNNIIAKKSDYNYN
jgi:hypothetical protein